MWALTWPDTTSASGEPDAVLSPNAGVHNALCSITCMFSQVRDLVPWDLRPTGTLWKRQCVKTTPVTNLPLTPDIAFHDRHNIPGHPVLNHPHRPSPLAEQALLAGHIAGTESLAHRARSRAAGLHVRSAQLLSTPSCPTLTSRREDGRAMPGQLNVPPRKWHRPFLVTTHWLAQSPSHAQLQGGRHCGLAGEELVLFRGTHRLTQETLRGRNEAASEECWVGRGGQGGARRPSEGLLGRCCGSQAP